MLPEAVTSFIAARGWGRVTGAQPVGSGGINDGRVLATSAGPSLFLKLNPSAPADMFAREAEGLAALAVVPGGPRVPVTFLAGEQYLLLEYLPSAPLARDYWPELGRRLARLHAKTNTRFGFAHDNYIGATPQADPWTPDGHVFFSEHRIMFQAQRAHARRLLDLAGLRRIEGLAARLPNLLPAQPASLIHGDLWSSNIIPGPDGQACLIDPAAHFGWAEADLAMTTLFGHPPDYFFSAYITERPLPPGFRDRFDLYNLYHLLNHLNLFGETYLPGVMSVLERYE